MEHSHVLKVARQETQDIGLIGLGTMRSKMHANKLAGAEGPIRELAGLRRSQSAIRAHMPSRVSWCTGTL